MNQLLENSIIGQDFLKTTEHPNIDSFLDYRLRLMDLKKHSRSFRERRDYKHEISATDEIIKKLSHAKS